MDKNGPQDESAQYKVQQIPPRSTRFDKYHRSRNNTFREAFISWFNGMSPVGNPESFRFDDEQVHQKGKVTKTHLLMLLKRPKRYGKRTIGISRRKSKRWKKILARIRLKRKKRPMSRRNSFRAGSTNLTIQSTMMEGSVVGNKENQPDVIIEGNRAIHLNLSELLDESGTEGMNSPSSYRKNRSNSSASIPMSHRQKVVHAYHSPSETYICPNNIVNTAKYTWFTFLPKSVLGQFKRVANFYFLLLVILQFLPVFAIGNPLLCAVPLTVIVFITSLKEGIEDLKRHASDNIVNNTIAYRVSCLQKTDVNIVNGYIDETLGILCPGKSPEFMDPASLNMIPSSSTKICCFTQCKWQDIRVGDIILIKADEDIPADCVVLATSEPAGTGLCYIETQNLDGETNLKIRHALHHTRSIKHPLESVQISGTIELEGPNPHLYSCTGKFSMDGTVGLGKPGAIPSQPVPNLDQKLPDITSPERTHCKSHSVTHDLVNHSQNHSRKSSVPAPNYPESSNNSTPLMINIPKRTVLADSVSPFGKGIVETLANNSPNMHSRNCSSVGSTACDAHGTDSSAPECEPVTIGNLLLRGCVLRNTDWVVACVVYTGRDTKIIRNSGTFTPSKRSYIERQMNPQIVINFVMLFVICMMASIFRTVGTSKEVGAPFSHRTFSEDAHGMVMNGFITFWFSLIIFQTIVPISLYITIELCKSFHAYFIHADQKMYDPDTKEFCTPKAWNLSDDLGQIEYLFSDKTGTLTKNVMTFRKCSVGGVPYGLDPPSSGGSWDPKDSSVLEMKKYMKQYGSGIQSGDSSHFMSSSRSTSGSINTGSQTGEKHIPLPHFVDPYFWEDLIEYDSHNAEHDFNSNLTGSKSMSPKDHANLLIEFFTMMASCHTVLVTEAHGGCTSKIRYKAQSPDEAALVGSASSLGFIFLSRTGDAINLKILNQNVQLKVLHVLEFDSFRKRMSVILRKDDGTIVLYCKGADDVIYDRLLPLSVCDPETSNDHVKNAQSHIRAATQQHLEAWAEKGLRTLCFAMRTIEYDEFQAWSSRYQQASLSFYHRELLQDTLADEIERDLILLGATAIEDQLQDKVPETLLTLRRAGIKTWVLTGDKLETAINVGFSSCLLTKDQLLFVVSEQKKGGSKGDSRALTVHEQLKLALSQKLALDAGILSGEDIVINNSKYNASNYHANSSDATLVASNASGNNDASDPDNSGYKAALIIDGAALKQALSPQLRTTFLELATRCSSVICCRVSPVQKARVVELVKRVKRAITLVVGDGANDVGMLRVADVGVGIRGGKEGQQAAMASDYTIGQFKYLSRLLLVHGRWSYHRSSSVTLMSFYKNMVFSLVLLWYQVDCKFTAQYIYDYMYMMFWNLFFCVAPILVLGILDKDVVDESILDNEFPQLYKTGIKHEYYSIGLFLKMLLESIYQSLVCYFVPVLIYSNRVQIDKTALGTVIAFSTLIISNLVLGIANKSWTIYTGSSIMLSFFMFVLLLSIFSFIKTETLYGVGFLVLSSPLFYFTVIITVLIALVPKLLLRYFRRQWSPTSADLIAMLGHLKTTRKNDIETPEMRESRSTFGSLASDMGNRYPKVGSLIMKTGSQLPNPPPSLSTKFHTQWFRRPSTHSTRQSHQPSAIPRPYGPSAPKSFWNMQTGNFEKLRGFAFSQEGGMTSAILHERVPFGALIPALGHDAVQKCKKPQTAKVDKRIGFMKLQ